MFLRMVGEYGPRFCQWFNSKHKILHKKVSTLNHLPMKAFELVQIIGIVPESLKNIVEGEKAQVTSTVFFSNNSV